MDLLAQVPIDTLLNLPTPETLPFGRYKGERWSDVPASYLNWMTQQTEMDPAIQTRAASEIAARPKNVETGEALGPEEGRHHPAKRTIS
jgi:hypothetical protein